MGLALLVLSGIHAIVFFALHPDRVSKAPILPYEFEPLHWLFYVFGHLLMWGLTIACCVIEFNAIGKYDQRVITSTADYDADRQSGGKKLCFLLAGISFSVLAWLRFEYWFGNPTCLAYSGWDWLWSWSIWFVVAQVYLSTIGFLCFGFITNRRYKGIGVGAFLGGVFLPIYLVMPFLTVHYASWLRGLVTLPAAVFCAAAIIRFLNAMQGAASKARQLSQAAAAAKARH